jgi:hypothetical protein
MKNRQQESANKTSMLAQTVEWCPVGGSMRSDLIEEKLSDFPTPKHQSSLHWSFIGLSLVFVQIHHALLKIGNNEHNQQC